MKENFLKLIKDNFEETVVNSLPSPLVFYIVPSFLASAI